MGASIWSCLEVRGIWWGDAKVGEGKTAGGWCVRVFEMHSRLSGKKSGRIILMMLKTGSAMLVFKCLGLWGLIGGVGLVQRCLSPQRHRMGTPRSRHQACKTDDYFLRKYTFKMTTNLFGQTDSKVKKRTRPKQHICVGFRFRCNYWIWSL